jgi:hypothetical protein
VIEDALKSPADVLSVRKLGRVFRHGSTP